MKIELKKRTTAIYGRVYFWVCANNSMISDTWTSDPEQAEKNFQDVLERAKQYPEDKDETIKCIEHELAQ